MKGFVAEEIVLDVIYLDKQSFYLGTAAAIKNNPQMLRERADKKPVPSCRAKDNNLLWEGRDPAWTVALRNGSWAMVGNHRITEYLKVGSDLKYH